MTIVQQAIEHYKYGISHDIFSEPVTSYARLSIEALKKQIPQKVINHGHLYGYACKCPVCNTFVTNNSGIHGNYCYNCGQALDWGEEYDRLY